MNRPCLECYASLHVHVCIYNIMHVHVYMYDGGLVPKPGLLCVYEVIMLHPPNQTQTLYVYIVYAGLHF